MMGIDEHKKHAPKKISMAVLSVSSTRHLKNDKSGLWIKDQAEREGHTVVLHRVIGDDQVGI
jgi:molybdenum cofactor biosynthesis protein B